MNLNHTITLSADDRIYLQVLLDEDLERQNRYLENPLGLDPNQIKKDIEQAERILKLLNKWPLPVGANI